MRAVRRQVPVHPGWSVGVHRHARTVTRMVASPHAKLHLHLHHLAQETDVVQDMLQGREEAKGFHLAKRSGSSLYEGDPAAPTSCFNPNQLQFSLKAACGARPGRAGDPTRQSQGPVTGYARHSLETPRALQQPEELASWLKCVLAAKLRSCMQVAAREAGRALRGR